VHPARGSAQLLDCEQKGAFEYGEVGKLLGRVRAASREF
jgi:hypothetical protein